MLSASEHRGLPAGPDQCQGEVACAGSPREAVRLAAGIYFSRRLTSMNARRRFAMFLAAVFGLAVGSTSRHPAFAAPPGSLTITVTMSEDGVFGGDSDNGKVKLSQPAPAGGVTVHLGLGKNPVMVPCNHPILTTSSLPASVPSCVSVPAGATSATFTATTVNVKTSKQVKLTATLDAASGKAAFLVNPVTVYFSQIPSGAMNWGSSATWAVKLSHIPKKGATVLLSSSNGSVTVPKSVKVPGGTFTATASTVSSCSMSPPSPASGKITATWEGASANAPVTVGQNNGQPSRYTNQTVRINPGTIIGISHDAHALVLNGADKCVQTLKTGNVMFLKNLGVLKVVNVMKTPQKQVAVAVKSAALTDFINDGTFQVFSQKLGDASEPGGSWKQGLEPDQPTGGDGDWKYKTSGSGTDYSFSAFKANNGLSASVTGHGQIANAGYNFLAVIHGDKLQQATFKVPLEGTLDVDWMAQTTSSGQGIGESRLRLPALHSGLVDSADGIPLLFQVYANLIFKPGFGEKAAAKGHFKITYKGEGGIDGSSPMNDSLDITPDISSTTSSAKAAHGAVVAVNAPKFALSLSTVSFLWAIDARMPGALNAKGADLADSMQSQLGAYVKADLMPPTTDKLFDIRRAAYVMWVSSVGYAGAGMLAMLPCQQYYQTYVVNAGMDKDMLGSISGSIPPDKGLEVFKKTGVTAIPSIKGCYPQK